MPLQDAFQNRPNRRSHEPVQGSPPSKADVSFLMERAAQGAPHPQFLRWQAGEAEQQFLLTVCYVDGADGEPTWELGPGDENAAGIFWSVTTENPGEIHRLIMKRVAPSPEAQYLAPRPEPMEARSLAKDSEGYRKLGEDEQFAGRYRVLHQIGHGGMGRIYQAVDMPNNRVVALKVLHPHLVEDEQARKRFEREARATIHLRHPNLLMVHDYGFSDEGLPFIAMEYLDGEVLQKLLVLDGPLEVRRFLTIFLQTCSALHHAHINRVIHRDVKPANIMLIKVDHNSDLAKLVDFGIAKIVRADGKTAQKLTQTGDVFGSPFYMSPEQCFGSELDQRSDLYSLGCVMYESISGKRPFEGPNALATMQMQVGNQPKLFDELCPELGVPKQIESLILRCLEKDPNKRFQSAKSLGQELERLLTVDKINLDNEWITNQTCSGTFYTVHQASGVQERADLAQVIDLLKQCDLINGNEYRHAMQLLGSQGAEVTRYLVGSGKVTEQTLHAAVQMQKIMERGQCSLERAVIALYYCHRNGCTLREAYDQLGWRMAAGTDTDPPGNNQ